MGNAARMASLMWASHMEQAMPETLAVVWVISIPSFRIMDSSKIVHSYTTAMQAKGIEQEILFHDLHAKSQRSLPRSSVMVLCQRSFEGRPA